MYIGRTYIVKRLLWEYLVYMYDANKNKQWYLLTL